MKQLELELNDNAYLGSSVGRDSEGRVIFVPYSIPGERVKIEIVETHARWARGEIREILQPSPHRVTPRCQHFMDCGGCHYQHMSYELQCDAKADILRSQLERIGGLTNPAVGTTIPSRSPWNTRNHIQFSLDPHGNLGFRAATSERVVPVMECHLPDPEINRLWPNLEIAPLPGLERVALRIGDPDQRMIVLHSSVDPDIEMEIDFPASVVWLANDRSAVLAGLGYYQITIRDHTFQVSAGSFFQVNSGLAPQLISMVLETVGVKPGINVLELYSGVGFFSAFLAEAGARITAIEQSPSAVYDFENNLNEFDKVELYHAPVENVFPSLSTHPDVVLVDPPRAGLGPKVLAGIIDLSPPRLVYVSCDPTTLARDARTLQGGGYDLINSTPIDMFPQTFHLESISIWEK